MILKQSGAEDSYALVKLHSQARASIVALATTKALAPYSLFGHFLETIAQFMDCVLHKFVLRREWGIRTRYQSLREGYEARTRHRVRQRCPLAFHIPRLCLPLATIWGERGEERYRQRNEPLVVRTLPKNRQQHVGELCVTHFLQNSPVPFVQMHRALHVWEMAEPAVHVEAMPASEEHAWVHAKLRVADAARVYRTFRFNGSFGQTVLGYLNPNVK
mmetsp:Transcript_116668/g.330007  ORF Transcript_116668/g.330007 Transcript_116668/m.330007 type:complete len:217 (+) Transcript_116668:113-763(+)